MRTTALTLFTLAILLISGCGSLEAPPTTEASTTPSLQVIETGTAPNDTVIEVIHMNNCGGKAEAKQVAQRSLSVVLEGDANLGVDVQIARASVAARYGESKSSSKTIELVAPSGTDMEFTLTWTEQQWLGTITSAFDSSEAKYRARIPISVELTSSRDLGNCVGGVAVQPTSDAIQQSPLTGGAAPTEALATATPALPTATSVPTTVTPDPTATPIPTPILLTPPGSVLRDGETWYADGWSLTVSNFTYKTLSAVRFKLRNLTNRTVLFPGTWKDLRVTSDVGENFACLKGDFPGQIEINAGAEVKWELDFSYPSGTPGCELYTSHAISPQARVLTLIVKDFSGVIEFAQWQTEIPRP